MSGRGFLLIPSSRIGGSFEYGACRTGRPCPDRSQTFYVGENSKEAKKP